MYGKKTSNEYSKKVRTVSNLSKIETLVTRVNLLMQKWIAESLNTYVATINTIMNQDLQLKKAKKYNVHQLLSSDVVQHRAFYRNLYQNYLVGNKWKYIVTLDEVETYQNYCNKKRLFITEN